MLFRIKSKIYREISKFFHYRPTSYPYISGDGFRSMADHVYDETGKCEAESIKDGQIIFLKSDLINDWFKTIHPKITAQYKLITHNSDYIIGEKEAGYIDDKIIHWFAQNNTFKHEKITPIPIGLENRSLYMGGWLFNKMFGHLMNISDTRKNRILYGFNIGTNPKERTAAINELRKCMTADEIRTRMSLKQYFKLLNKYHFVASPEGNGPDCIRTWEALILGIIPIIKNSSNNQILTQNKLPILIIDEWEDLKKFNEDSLNEIRVNYESIEKSDITMFDYWKNIIRNNE